MLKRESQPTARIGISGRMGAGKSTFCRKIRAAGKELGQSIVWIEADKVRRSLAASGAEVDLREALRQEVVKHTGIVLLEWAMLVEDEMLALVDYNVCDLSCPRQTLLTRLAGGDLEMEEVKARLGRQLDDETRKTEIKLAQRAFGKGCYWRVDSSQVLSVSAINKWLHEFSRLGALL